MVHECSPLAASPPTSLYGTSASDVGAAMGEFTALNQGRSRKLDAIPRFGWRSGATLVGRSRISNNFLTVLKSGGQ